ncbi:type IV pilin [Halorubrum aethiopicum]|uniref:type IV pilin n=1 Tax=Halorubrum aethiopicum TaxID=1758255 RepID=UPI0009B5B9C2|nr:type IV pilin N-terminal domain-containing protein [Halorubrum aethiopicum]
MKPSNLFKTDDRAVSPVIGVILMVAITVILAAVIGTFVLGLGDSLGDSQPTAQLDVSIDEANNQTIIEHAGGDSIDSDSLRVIVTSDGNAEGNDTITQRLSVGDRISSATGTGQTVSSGEEVRVRIIHQPSDSILADRTFEVTDEFVYDADLNFS